MAYRSPFAAPHVFWAIAIIIGVADAFGSSA